MCHIARNTNNPNYLLQKLWNTYVSSTAYYGADVMQIMKKWLEDLEKIQHDLIRCVYKLPHYVANAALHILSNIQMARFKITNIKIRFLQ